MIPPRKPPPLPQPWLHPAVGNVPRSIGPDESTPPHGMVSVMGARLSPNPGVPAAGNGMLPPRPVPPPPKRGTLPGMPAPPPNQLAHVPVPEFDPDDKITQPASPAYRMRRLVIDFESLPEFDKRRVERHIEALLKKQNKL